MGLTRRQALGGFAGVAAAGATPCASAEVSPNWSSLVAAFRIPDWFRDAKFGIWAHWSAQCVPEFGDWYGRKMYVQGDPFYDHHRKHYGHPADRGFLEIENAWKAENWEPESLIKRYKAAGARYFMALANHHDNLDMWDSKYQPWNSVAVGPKKDLIGGWAKAAKAQAAGRERTPLASTTTSARGRHLMSRLGTTSLSRTAAAPASRAFTERSVSSTPSHGRAPRSRTRS